MTDLTRTQPIPDTPYQARELSAAGLDRLFAGRDRHNALIEAGEPIPAIWLAGALRPHGLVPVDLLELTDIPEGDLETIGLGPTLDSIISAAKALNPYFFGLVRPATATPPAPDATGAGPSAG